MLTKTNAPEGAIEQYETEFTSTGLRLQVTRWTATIFVSVESNLLDLKRAEKSVHSLGQVGLVTWTTQADMHRLTKHFLSHFDDAQLVAYGVDAINKCLESLTEGEPKSQAADSSAN